ncbi:MAG TPA: peptide ABC transporter substrate-binding protein [Verrucomicrobiae bacterium]|nr:peptide ABC transporter substrate-binding protein [Verrucomicrobiae bacterium]
MRVTALLALVLLALPALPGCTKASQSAATGNELRIALPIEPTQLNPILEQNAIENTVDGLMFDELVTLDAQQREVPDLAETVPTLANGGVSKDGLTIVYHLRHGVKWHDGAPFTSRDVKFTWQAIMNPSNNVVSRRGYDQVASVDTPDDYTVIFHMKHIFPPAVDTIFGESDTPYRILPAHLLAKYPNLNQVPFNSAPVGTGPYEFARWQHGDRIVLRANPNYFRGAAHVATLTLLDIPNDDTTVAQLRTREAQLAIEITLSAYNELSGDSRVTRQLVTDPSFVAIYFNTARTPLDDVRVRRALVEGMDRAAIVRDDTYGTGTLAVADLSPFYWAFDASLKPVPYDVAAAKALLQSAGWTPGPDGVRVKDGKRLSLQLVFGQGSQTARTLAAQVQQMLKPLGVEIELKNYDYAVLYAAQESGGILNSGKFDLAVYSWVAGGDPDNASDWTCAAIPPGGNNVTRYCSPEMDALQHLALSTFDRNVRKAAYAKIEALLLRDVPAAFLFYQPMRYAHVPELQNFTPNGISEGWNAQDWAL